MMRRAHDEVVDAERRAEARGAARREHVDRARRVVAGGLGRVVAEEDGAGRVDAVEQRRPDRVDLRARGARRRASSATRAASSRSSDDEDAARARAPRPPRSPGAGASRAAPRPRAPRPRPSARESGDEQRDRRPRRARPARGDRRRRRAASAPSSATTRISLGPAIESMSTSAEDEALRARDVEVARADDLVDARTRLGAVRERADGLRAARVDDLGDAGELRRGEDLGRRARRREDDARHAGDRRRDRRHEHGRRVARLAAGRVDAGARTGRTRCPSSMPLRP